MVLERLRLLIGHRGRTVIQTGAWAIIARACGAANIFISVPFVLGSLGTEQFGVWASLCALSMLSGFFDFGIGNGAMNLIASSKGRNADHEIPRIIFCASRALSKLTAWLGALVAIPWLLTPWEVVLGLPAAFSDESTASIGFIVLAILLGAKLGLSTKIQLGLGHGEKAYRWQAIASLITLGSIIGISRFHPSLASFTAAAVLLPLIGPLVNTIDLWRGPLRRKGKESAPRELAQLLRRSGMQFFFLQLSAAIAFSTDLPLLTIASGPESAANYAIPLRLFSVIPMGFSLLWMALWPIYRTALAAGDAYWVGLTLRRSLLGAGCLALILSAAMVVYFEPMCRIWLGHTVDVSKWLLVGFAVWCVADALGGATATLLNSAGIMKPQLWIAAVFVVLSLPLKIWALSAYGITAVIWVTGFLFISVNLLPLLLIRHRLAAKIMDSSY